MIANPDIHADILANPTSITGAALGQRRLRRASPYIGTPILVLGMVCVRLLHHPRLVATTATAAPPYLFGRRGASPYQVLYVAVALLGRHRRGRRGVDGISDIGNALMAVAQHRRHSAAFGHGRAGDAALRLRRATWTRRTRRPCPVVESK